MHRFGQAALITWVLWRLALVWHRCCRSCLPQDGLVPHAAHAIPCPGLASLSSTSCLEAVEALSWRDGTRHLAAASAPRPHFFRRCSLRFGSQGVSLILACRTQAEILMREAQAWSWQQCCSWLSQELEKLAASPAVNVWFQLSRPGPDWPGSQMHQETAAPV